MPFVGNLSGVKKILLLFSSSIKQTMYSKRPELDTLLNQGWEVRKWFESLEIFTVADIESGSRTPTW